MEWVKLSNGNWQAKGKYGEFLLWKRGRHWTGKYSGKNVRDFKLPTLPLRKLKAICEENWYWE